MKDVLFIRLDNMGDVILLSPAIRALKTAFKCRVTLLTSTAGSLIASHIGPVDEVLAYDVPWMKNDAHGATDLFHLTNLLREKRFDAAVIPTVFSQSPLPAAMLASMAEIPVRVAYCRENPYGLLTHWIPDEEPYRYIRHQVLRDLELVTTLGADVADSELTLDNYCDAVPEVWKLLKARGLDPDTRWVIVHPGVSESKRQYPLSEWVTVINGLGREGVRLVLTGGKGDDRITAALTEQSSVPVINMCGCLSMKEFIALVSIAPLVISVNTVTPHIAAATQTPVIVLYALTNPQHSPWRARGKVLVFDVPVSERSSNVVLRYYRDRYLPKDIPPLKAERVVETVLDLLLSADAAPMIPELIRLDGTPPSDKESLIFPRSVEAPEE